MVPSAPDYDIAIVGASFAGLACAREAARRDLRVLVVDRLRAPGDKIHTTGILVKEAQDEWAAPSHLVRQIKRVRVYSPSHRSLALERDDYFFLATDTQGLLNHLTEEVRDEGVEVRFGEAFEGAARGRWLLGASEFRPEVPFPGGRRRSSITSRLKLWA